MTVEQYWQGRLLQEHPLYDVTLREEGYNLRSWSGKLGLWPRAVARQALYQDYQAWHDKVFVPEFRDKANGGDFDPPGALPEFQFFVTMAPWLYVDGKRWHVKNYNVKCTVTHNMKPVMVVKRRYFVRLCQIERHIEAFERSVSRRIRPKREQPEYT